MNAKEENFSTKSINYSLQVYVYTVSKLNSVIFSVIKESFLTINRSLNNGEHSLNCTEKRIPYEFFNNFLYFNTNVNCNINLCHKMFFNRGH